MRMSQEEKERSHVRIVASASRLFRERGVEGAAVADVMEDAGMTHGGFYKHFDSKEALLDQALEEAFSKMVDAYQAADASNPSSTFKALYLSREHIENPAMGCPAAALGTEIARGSAQLKKTFGAGVRRMVEAIAGTGKRASAGRRAAALRECSMLVGAMVIARASDPELAAEIRSACGGETSAAN